MANGYEYAYIGRKRDCGCVVAIVVDQPEYRRDVAKTVAEFIKDGYDVERVSLAEGKQLVGRCKHEAQVEASAQGALL